ncbi:MAG: ABC transporter permease [Actinomycetota bacterium]|nr:ABC transporter permease [Actinomycetota bacterium]
MLRIALKGVLAHKVRLAMTALAIVLGVAFVSGTYVFTDSIQRSFDSLMSDVNEGVDLYVRGTTEFGFGGVRIDEALVDRVRDLPEVAVAAPSVEGIAQLVDEQGEPIGGNGPPTFGFSYVPEGEGLTPLVIREGDWPRSPTEVVVDAFAADAGSIEVGDVIEVILPIGTEVFTISGIATFGDAENLLGATLAVFEFETAQRAFDAAGSVDTIAVVVFPGADPALVAAQIADFLPDRAEVVTGEQQTDDDVGEFTEGLSFINTILLVIGGVAVFVGAFLIQNTFRIIVAQRIRELALLRAIGATRGQVTRMVVLEALAVGLVASAVGVGAGILIALGLKAAFAGFGFGIPTTGIVLLPRTIVVGMTVGIVVTIAAALVPARRAARTPPIAALRDVAAPPRSLGTRIAAGTAVTGMGFSLVLLGLFVQFGNAVAVVGIGALVTFTGVSILAPLVAAAFARSAGAPLRRMGIVGRLAQENAIRRPRRTAATASALMIGVALVSVIAVFQGSAKASVAAAFREDNRSDFQVQLGSFGDPASSGLSPALTADLRELEVVGSVARGRLGEYRSGPDGGLKFMLGVDGPIGEQVVFEMADGSLGDLGPGTAVISAAEARAFDVGLGDFVRVQVSSGAYMELTVVGVFEAAPIGASLVIDLATYEQYNSFRLDQFAYVQVADGFAAEEVRPAIEEVVAGYPNAKLTNTEELIADTEDQIDTILNLLVVLLGFALVIALLGIVNTLALSIAERRREIGLVRAVGMERRQVRRMIRWEAVLIAVFGGVLGLVVGVVLGSALVLAIGQGFTLAIPWVQLIVYLVLAALGGVLAAWIPARRGARMKILDAIAYE